jgi:hypothetical protein
VVSTCADLDPVAGAGGGAAPITYAHRIFDVFRVYYLLDEGRDIATGAMPEEMQEKISFDTNTIAAPAAVRDVLRAFWQPYANHSAHERPRMDLLLHFLRLMIEEAGMATSEALQNDVDALLSIFAAKYSFGDVSVGAWVH